MKALESLLAAPVIVTLLGGAQIVLRGRAEAEDVVIATTSTGGEIAIDPIIGLMILGALLLSGIVLVAREMHAEAKDNRHREDLTD